MSPAQRETRAFVVAHVVLLLVVLVGFGRSFYLRSLFLSSALPARSVAHGVVLSLWFVLVVVQGTLALSGRKEWHARIAWLSLPMVAAMIATGLWVTTALAAQLTSADEPENFFVWTDYFTVVSVTVMIWAAVTGRRNLGAHRRLILFASILMTAPAIARIAFWPILKLGLTGAPLLGLGGLVLLVASAVAYDFATLRRVHRATLGGIAGVALPWLGGAAMMVTGAGFALVKGGV